MSVPMDYQAEMRGGSGGWELPHRYGERVHILDNVYLLSALARIGSPNVAHRDLMALLRSVYQTLLMTGCGRELPRVKVDEPTRMAATQPHRGVYHGAIFDPAANVVVVDIIRAGIVPSQVCFELLTAVLSEKRVRLDHLNMARRSDDAGHVTGVDLSGSKIGGGVDGCVMLLPDPMGATGKTTVRALEHYHAQYGKPAKIVALPMIATPEYLRNVLEAYDNLVVYTARLDRGMSDPEVLASMPGTYWDRERGLDEKSYIVPGAGGMGEVINNSWC
ncbi:MAG: uracil phosphoribosyltransferase [Planctomycetes bacterium]|nr:uracil phosphoribosyltransferase [Planctomycetota bacterium]